MVDNAKAQVDQLYFGLNSQCVCVCGFYTLPVWAYLDSTHIFLKHCFLQDFYLDLSDEDKRISPRDYLEAALQPIPGQGKSIGAKNEVILISSASLL